MHARRYESFLAAAVWALVISAPNALAADANPAEDPYASRKVFYEEHWRTKIVAALGFVRGAVVQVNVDLSTELQRTEEVERFAEPAAVQRTTKLTRKSTAKETLRVVAETPPKRFLSDDPSAPTEEVTEESDIRSVIPRSKLTTTHAGLVPNSVSVSVSVPSSYYEAVLRRRLADTETKPGAANRADELAKIEDEVQSKVRETVAWLLPREPLGEESPRVKVVSFDVVGE